MDTAKPAVVVQATQLGLEMTAALAHRSVEGHLIDPAAMGACREGALITADLDRVTKS